MKIEIQHVTVLLIIITAVAYIVNKMMMGGVFACISCIALLGWGMSKGV